MHRFIRRAPISLLLAVLPAVVGAQGQRPMTFEDVLALKRVSDPQISPDGKWVAYVVTAADMKENANDADVWLASTAGGEPIRLTTSKKNDNTPRWSPDGRRIAFISGRSEKPQLYLISPSGGEAEQLTESKTGVSQFDWSPDGKRIAFVARRDPTAAEEKAEKEKDDAMVMDSDFKSSWLWTIDIATKKAAELVKSDLVAGDPRWSPDGKSIAYSTVPTTKADDGSLSDIWVVGADGSTPRKLTTNEGPDFAARWSPDGRTIAYLSRDLAHGALGQAHLTVMSSDGSGSHELAPAFLYQTGTPTWSANGKTIFFDAQVRTTSQLFSVPVEGGAPTQLTHAHVISGWTMSADGSAVAMVLQDLQHPADVYAAKLTALAAAKRVTDHNPQLRDVALANGEVIRWKSSDGKEIEGVLLYPIGYQKGKRYPLVAEIHGGPAGAWSEAFPGSWGNSGHVWAAKGWAVFYPNIRGSSGYGEDFLLANVKDWGGGDFKDIQTGLDHLVAMGLADPERLAQSGWSYGGYMTAWTLTQTNRFKAVMVGAGLTDMFSMYSTNDLQRVLDGYFGNEPWNDVQGYTSRSAMSFIKQAKTPTLIQHGAADTRVPIGQSQELYMGLKKNHVPVQLVLYPREPHGLQEPRHQLDKMRREYAWFSQYVLGDSAKAAIVQ